MPKDLRAQLGGPEFDPSSELHHPVLIVKLVDPGCTTELQIEDVRTGVVTRLTTTEDPAADDEAFERAIVAAWRTAWSNFSLQEEEGK